MAKNEKTNAVNETLALPLNEEFDRDLEARLAESERAGIVTIAVLDLDHFLQVNERFGYAAGDQALIDTGRYLLEKMPAGTGLYRYAGDMFALLFPAEVEREDAFLLLEDIRKNNPVRTPDGSPQTLTIGIAAAPEDGARVSELLRKAQSAMFRGKANGANRVCLAREEKMVTKTSHYTAEQLQQLTKLSRREGIGEAVLLREALDALLQKYDV